MSCLEMKCLSGIWKRILMLFAVFFVMMVSLPAYAERLPDFLAKVQPSEIFPGADRYGKPEGKPLVARVYKGEEQLGLVYITTDVVNTRGIRANRSIRWLHWPMMALLPAQNWLSTMSRLC